MHAPRTLTQPDSCWALPPSWKPFLEAATRLFLDGAPREAIRETLPDQPSPEAAVMAAQQQPVSSVAVIPVIGPVSYRADWFSEMFGGASVSSIAGQLKRAAADPNVTAILMPIDSPGGSVYGLMELAQQMRAVRASKPVITIADPMAASAAYYIGAQGTEFSITPSGEAGSIGVFMMHVDMSQALEDQGIKVTFISQGKYKTEGNPYEPLSDEAAAALQATVDHYYGGFLADVAKGRGVSVKDVRAGFGQGRMLTAPDALAAGMVDRIGTFSDTLDRVASGKWKAPGAKKAEDEPMRLSMEKDPEPEPEPQQEPAPPAPVDVAADDGYDDLASAYLSEWEQSDAETCTGR
jgi:signal peptide peptidase SppA